MDKQMKLSDEIEASLMEKLSLIEGVTSKKMFGGYGIMYESKMFGMISAKGQMYFKVDQHTQKMYEEKGSEKHSRMPYYSIPQDVLDNRELLFDWAEKAIQVTKR